MKIVWKYAYSFRHNTRTWRTDGRTPQDGKASAYSLARSSAAKLIGRRNRKLKMHVGVLYYRRTAVAWWSAVVHRRVRRRRRSGQLHPSRVRGCVGPQAAPERYDASRSRKLPSSTSPQFRTTKRQKIRPKLLWNTVPKLSMTLSDL